MPDPSPSPAQTDPTITPTTQTPDTSSTPSTTSLASSAPTEPTAPAGAPEAYADFKLPEGFTFEGETLASAKALFKELNLPQEAAQKLIDFQTARDTAARNSNVEAFTRMRTEWRDQVKADPKLGPNLQQVLADIGRSYNHMDQDVVAAFKEAMDLTGAGDNPAILRGFHAFAKLINEGTPVSGQGPSPNGQTAPGTKAKPTQAQAMYPDHPYVATPPTPQ